MPRMLPASSSMLQGLTIWPLPGLMCGHEEQCQYSSTLVVRPPDRPSIPEVVCPLSLLEFAGSVRGDINFDKSCPFEDPVLMPHILGSLGV